MIHIKGSGGLQAPWSHVNCTLVTKMRWGGVEWADRCGLGVSVYDTGGNACLGKGSLKDPSHVASTATLSKRVYKVSVTNIIMLHTNNMFLDVWQRTLVLKLKELLFTTENSLRP